MTSSPVMLRYEGDGEFRAASKFMANRCDRDFVCGETYPMEVRHDRSSNSHRHYFATINEAHANLPDHLAERFPTSEHLRKWCLVKAGYRDERTFPCASKAEALRLAAFVKPMDEFAVVIAREGVVTVYTAKSQAVKAMGRKEFTESKQKVLDILAEMLGVELQALAAHVKSAPAHQSRRLGYEEALRTG